MTASTTVGPCQVVMRDIAGVTYIGSNAKAGRDLGFAPRPLEEGLPETLRWEAARLGTTPKR